ncbi:MAG: carbohydrate binding family 9 domain-containing protein [Ferruginibacter sp.]|nr:carbohydrate binding family 9 domain-containing protein [Cytophagales bacterium]
MRYLYLSLAGWLGVAAGTYAQEATTFDPVEPPREIKAYPITGPITVDGRLEEAQWQGAPPASQFFQVEPNQGKPLAFDTKVWVLQDRRYLYFGVFSADSLGPKGIRAPSLQRDFASGSFDQVSLVFDPFRDKRNAVVFATHPYGAQRDLLAFDAAFFDDDWDSYWRVRTSRTDSGWVAEFAIPWKTLRYPKNSTQWGFQVGRVARRINQASVWSPHPRSFPISRTAYAGILTGLTPPPPSANIRLQPYLLVDYNRNQQNGARTREETQPKVGGDLKWAITPNTVLDVTFNTDFAQADADRQVQNLTRFSVFFPERRQFFLENASLFSPGLGSTIRPFFSRRIGLSPTGQPIPIDAGARLVRRNARQSWGGLLVHQRATDALAGMTAAVGRYSQNIGKQNRIGALWTMRLDEGRDSLPSARNLVGAVDGFFRLSQPLSFDFMLSGSATSGRQGDGIMGYGQFNYSTPQASLYAGQSWITRGYNPALGFIYGSDLVQTFFGGYPNYRPEWKPKFLRSFEPDLNADIYHRVSDGALLQYELATSPVFLNFQSGALFIITLIPTFQRLDAPFRPVGLAELEIPEGKYRYLRYRLYYGSDQSKKLAYSLTYEDGKYYPGNLQSWTGSLRCSPIPHVALSLTYQQNRFQRLGTLEDRVKVTQLLTPEVRLAVNPRLQLIGFYQKNTAANRDAWNLRFAWEFQPLSFLYLVYNRNATRVETLTDGPDRFRQEQVIGKITYLKQF